jgi:enoyl-CoA hydratase
MEYVNYTVADGVAEISMHREPVNALDHQLVAEIQEAHRRAGADDEARAIILRSDIDGVFSGGADLKMAQGFDGMAQREYLEQYYYSHHELLYRLGKPTIAAVEGDAIGGGVGLAAMCNCIIAGEDAEFNLTELDVGYVPSVAIAKLPQQMSTYEAFEVIFGEGSLSPERASEVGLVNRVVPSDQVTAEARELAGEFARVHPEIMRISHNAFMRIHGMEFQQNFWHIIDLLGFNTELQSSQEGRDAFVESRDPDW